MRELTITALVSDDELANFLNRLADRGRVTVDGETTDTALDAATIAADEMNDGEVAALDSTGTPWDARFHSSTKTMKKDGSWTAVRNMDAATKAAALQYQASFQNVAAPVVEPVPPVVAPVTVAPVVASPGLPSLAVPTVPTVPVPVTFEELTAGFAEVITAIGQPALMEKLGDIYIAAGVDPEGKSLQTNETQRAQVLAAILAIQA